MKENKKIDSDIDDWELLHIVDGKVVLDECAIDHMRFMYRNLFDNDDYPSYIDQYEQMFCDREGDIDQSFLSLIRSTIYSD